MTPSFLFRERSKRRSRLPHRRGAILVVALVCLLVMMSILGQMLLGSIRAHRALHPERDLRQTELLLAAGADRASLRLAKEPNYRGETWNLPAATIVGRGDGQVTISATRDADDKPWQVRVVAEYPRGGETPIRRSRTILIPLKSTHAPQSQE